MPRDPLRMLVRSVGRLADTAGVAVPDAELLERFVRLRDQAAFELLLWRHGTLVLSTCKRLLADGHDAEDAFQTTFLILVRKAAAIRRGETLGGWLYQVAYRVCLRLGASRAKRAAREQPGVDALASPEPVRDELAAVLDDEIQRLPTRQRLAFILCCLEGKTGAEAAQLLGCAPGTVSSRLSRARERLRSRLTRRGIVVPATLGFGVASEALAGTLPSRLLASTVAVAVRVAAGQPAEGLVSAQILSHVEGVLRAMFYAKLKNAACVVTVLGLLLTGGTFVGQALLAQQHGPGAPPAPALGLGVTPLVVTVAKPEPGTLPSTWEYSCVAEASQQAEIMAHVGGVLTQVNADVGKRVKKGEILAKIDAPLVGLDVELADNAVQQARFLLAEADADVAIARGQVELAKKLVPMATADSASAKAAADDSRFRYERDLRMPKGEVSKAELAASLVAAEKFRFDARAKEAAVAVAQAEVSVKEGKLTKAEAMRRTAESKIEAAQVAAAKARLSLESTTIRSPIDGVVTMQHGGVGASVAVSANGSASLFTVQRLDPLRVVMQVPERDAATMAVGTEVELQFPTLGNLSFKGQRVTRAAVVVDPKTQTMWAEILVANPQQRLRPGMVGNAVLHVPGNHDAKVLRIPLAALQYGKPQQGYPGMPRPGMPGSAMPGPGMPGANPGKSGESYVYVVRDGKAHRTEVRYGRIERGEVEIVFGLRPEDLVVTNPEILAGAAVPVQVKTAPR